MTFIQRSRIQRPGNSRGGQTARGIDKLRPPAIIDGEYQIQRSIARGARIVSRKVCCNEAGNPSIRPR